MDSSKPITIAVESSEVGIHKSNGQVTRIHDRKKYYIKIRFVVEIETREIVAIEVAMDDVHDSRCYQH